MTSIQIRRISERINRYFSKFGYRTHTEYQKTRAQVYAAKDLGLDQIECKIAETSRGTAIGFYSKNSWVNFIVFSPFIMILALSLLNENNLLPTFLSGSEAFIDLKSLFSGNLQIDFLSVTVVLLIPLIFSLMSYSFQQIRLNYIKLRFSFFTKDANWNPSDLTPTMIAFRGAQTAFFHGWLLAVIYFSVFAMSNTVMEDVLALYQITEETLRAGVNQGFMIISGALIGLVSADKANKLRRFYSKQDKSLREGSGIMLRRIEGILYSLISALLAGIFFLAFLSVTYVQEFKMTSIILHVLGYLIAAVVAGYIREEGALTFATSYGALLLFLSLGMVFRTGAEPAFAFVVILQLLMIPMSILLIANRGVDSAFQSFNVRTIDHYYQIIPINVFVSLYLLYSRRKRRREQYEKALVEDTVIEDEEGRLLIDKRNIEKKGGDTAVIIAKHYFELLTWYSSSFEENQLVLIPTANELLNYWKDRTGKLPKEEDYNFISTADRLIWDTEVNFPKETLSKVEKVGKKLALELR